MNNKMTTKKENHTPEDINSRCTKPKRLESSGSPSGEKPLSEKVLFADGNSAWNGYFLWLTDVKQAVKRLKELGKERLHNKEDYEWFCEDIDKIFGFQEDK